MITRFHVRLGLTHVSQSMGSLGQYKGEVSNVHDVHIENVWMMNGDVSHICGTKSMGL